MIDVKELQYQTRLLDELRERYKKEKIISEKEKLKRIGISRKLLLEEQYREYREQLYQEVGDDNFAKMVIDVLVNIG
jgi:hypothetical protein